MIEYFNKATTQLENCVSQRKTLDSLEEKGTVEKSMAEVPHEEHIFQQLLL